LLKGPRPSRRISPDRSGRQLPLHWQRAQATTTTTTTRRGRRRRRRGAKGVVQDQVGPPPARAPAAQGHRQLQRGHPRPRQHHQGAGAADGRASRQVSHHWPITRCDWTPLPINHAPTSFGPYPSIFKNIFSFFFN